jgi:peptidoglycan/xylan/chitin deacetylase (PgdA/CDA1 family)
VFHLHEVSQAWIEPRLRYLADNGYRTATADEIAHYVTGRGPLGPRRVALTFDDARASLWTVAAPLLRKYGLTAIAFAIPARITDAATVRPTIADGADRAEAADDSDTPFVTWPELQALQASGTIDVQAHTFSHAAIFCSDRTVGFVTPDYARETILDRPLISEAGPPRFLEPDALGAPLYARRSRMSDGRRFLVHPEVVSAARAHVAEHGGAAFFARPDWRSDLERALPQRQGDFETEDAQRAAIEEELDRCRSVLHAQLGTSAVRHIALPWGIAGAVARDALRRSGYGTAYLEEMFGRQGVRPGGDPYRIMRLNGKYLQCLPGRGRRFFTALA